MTVARDVRQRLPNAIYFERNGASHRFREARFPRQKPAASAEPLTPIGAKTVGIQRIARRSADAFTLVEMLVVISIIGVLSTMVLFALAGVQEESRVDRTRAQIARINTLLMERWESYRTRRMPRAPLGSSVIDSARYRLDAMRQLMKMELPDRKSDLIPDQNPKILSGVYGAPASLWKTYQLQLDKLVRQRIKDEPNPPPWTNNNGWTVQYQSAECLYLILSQIRDEDSTALEFLTEKEIGDIDQDGVPEILDGWGNPIIFVRWAPGFGLVRGSLEAGTPITEPQMVQTLDAPDPFDHRRIYASQGTFALYPLILSAGPDKKYDIAVDTLPVPLVYDQTLPPNNPFVNWGPAYEDSPPLGSRVDADNDGDNSLDNIHNLAPVAGG